jgi:GT2 family glycosyltransferase
MLDASPLRDDAALSCGALPTPSGTAGDPRLSVVVLTHDRPAELAGVLQRLAELPERPAIIVVDNASRGEATANVRRSFPGVQWVACAHNLGAAGRNAGVEQVRTSYVAFCDDDTWWAPGALARAADLLDAYPVVGVVAGRVLVGPASREDPTCREMAASPIDPTGLPGPALASFMAGASVIRTQAFRKVGGYEPRLFLGAEELLVSLDLAAHGWRIVYAPDVVAHHHPSPAGRDPIRGRIALARNRVWIACMRLPWRVAARLCARSLHHAWVEGVLGRSIMQALAGMPWALWRRRRVPTRVAEILEIALDAAPLPTPGRRRTQ